MMPTFYHCPRCQSFHVKEHERSVFCSRCELNFDKKFLQLLADGDILANEELEGIFKVFTDNPDDFEDSDDYDGITLIP